MASEAQRTVDTASSVQRKVQAWLADVLARIADYPTKQVTDLLLWNWRTAP